MRHTYDDAWLIANWGAHRFTSELAKAYNDAHGTCYSYECIVHHCKHKLGLEKERRPYTEEMERWLFENYPKHRLSETARLFNERFNDSRTRDAIKTYCERKFGLHLDKGVRSEIATENRAKSQSGVHDVGQIVNKKGTLYRKTGKGRAYRLLSDEVVGKPPQGLRIVYLDGDRTNCKEKNMMFAPQQDMCLMSVYKLWSGDAEVTRTGLMACRLQNAIKEDT